MSFFSSLAKGLVGNIPIVGGLAAEGVGALLKHRAGQKQAKALNANAEAQRFAKQRQAEIGVQAGEDTRLGRLSLAKALLGGLPAQTAGGRVNTNAQIDPAVLESLGARRSYDFSKAFAPDIPDQTAGATSGFLGGLAGTLGNAAIGYGLKKKAEGQQQAGEMAGPSTADIVPGGAPLSPEDVLKAYGRG